MNFIVALLLMQLSEESAFWLLVALMKKYEMEGQFLPDMQRMSLLLCQFDFLFEKLLSPLYKHFKQEHVEVNMFAFSWFHVFYIYSFPYETLFRIWDLFLSEGISIIFRVGLAILKQSKAKLMTLGCEEIIEYLRSIILNQPGLLDAEPLIRATLKIKKVKRSMKMISPKLL